VQTLTFYSYKGGTGRSLALANAAVYLARLEFSVIALDFDLEAPGLNYKFSKSPNVEPIPVERGIVDYLSTFVTTGNLPATLQEFTVVVDVPGTEGRLRLFGSGQAPSPRYWSNLAKLNWHELFYAPNASGVQLLFDLRARIQDELNPDFLLIDSRTGITEMGGIATTLLADKLICLVLPTLENLEGARAVLRSIRRSRRESELEEIEMMMALSRLPSMKDSEEEKAITDRIRHYIGEEAEDLEDTVPCSDIYVLHRESALETTESLRVGSGISPDESILLRDYLRLFANVVPKDLVETKVSNLIQLAKEKLWENPSAAVKEVEELAESFGHPETYRALLRFYDVRNVSGTAALRKAQRLWEITRDSHDQILWQTLKRTFEPMAAQNMRTKRDEWNPNLDFVESVWKSAGNLELEFGLKLATAWERQERPSRAADVCLELVGTDNATAGVIARAIRLLDETQRSPEAALIIEHAKTALVNDPYFVEAWAKHTLRNRDKDRVQELQQTAVIETLRRANPQLAARIYLASSMVEEANDAASDALAFMGRPRAHMNQSEIEETAELFVELGRWEEFESQAIRYYPVSWIEDVRERAKRHRRVVRPRTK
jgi:MinD-like ATPase involved in chromosome partitioning or flagellar assembly